MRADWWSGILDFLSIERPLRSVGPGVEQLGGPDATAARIGQAEIDWGLTHAQARVLHQLVRGQTNKEIAHDLGIEEGTVEARVGLVQEGWRVQSDHAGVPVLDAPGLTARDTDAVFANAGAISDYPPRPTATTVKLEEDVAEPVGIDVSRAREAHTSNEAYGGSRSGGKPAGGSCGASERSTG